MAPHHPVTAAPNTPLYRGMARAELHRAYSPSSMVASIDPFLKRYADESAAARAAFAPSQRKTVAYGGKPTQTIDLFLPDTGPAPLLLFIHGGYWQALSKADASFPAPAITRAGFAYGALDYTLAPAASLDEIVEETRAAITCLWSQRASIGISGGLILAGHSAGAHLVAIALTTDWPARGVDPAFIKGSILVGGIYDLEPIRLTYVNDPLRLDAAAARRNSPLFAKPTIRAPIVITWAERDTDEFKRQSRAIADAWSLDVDAVTTFEQAGNHFDCLFDWCDPSTRLSTETERLLRRGFLD